MVLRARIKKKCHAIRDRARANTVHLRSSVSIAVSVLTVGGTARVISQLKKSAGVKALTHIAKWKGARANSDYNRLK